MASKHPSSANDNARNTAELERLYRSINTIIRDAKTDDRTATAEIERILGGLTTDKQFMIVNYAAKGAGIGLLHQCVKKQRHECLAMLLEKGASASLPSINKTSRGSTPLAFACFEMDEAMVQLMLLYDGARPFTLNKDHQSPLHVACYMHAPRIATSLLNHLAEHIPKEQHADIINQPDDRGNTPLHYAMMHGRESVALRLIELGARKDIINKAGQTPFQACYNNIQVRHMAEAFIAHVILPALVLETGKAPDTLIGYKPDKVRHIVEELTPDVLKALCETGTPYNFTPEENDSMFFRPLRLVGTWQHPPINFPTDLIKINHERCWKPLVPDEFKANNGLSITSLTSYKDLMEDSKQLRHCVGTSAMYVQRCCETKPDERIHILSLQKNGEHVSTVDVRLSSYRHYSGAQQSVEVPSVRPTQFLHVIMHRGKDNRIIDRKDPEYTALSDFLTAVKTGKFLKQGTNPPDFTLQTNQNQLGETDTSRQKVANHNAFERFCGHEPSTQALEACFYEYKRTNRAASSGKHDNDTLKYDVVSLENPLGMDYHADSHFIDGTTAEGIRYRHMDVQGWLKTTGLMERIHEVIKQEFPMAAKAQAPVWAQQAQTPITESSPPPAKPPSQHEDIKERIERAPSSFVSHSGIEGGITAANVVPLNRYQTSR